MFPLYGLKGWQACGARKEYTESVDAELKQHLVDMEGRILASVNEAEGRTLASVNEAEGRTLASLKEYVNERCEMVETKLLTEFHKWASPAEARSRTISAALRAIDLEMESLTDRVSKLEGNQPQ